MHKTWATGWRRNENRLCHELKVHTVFYPVNMETHTHRRADVSLRDSFKIKESEPDDCMKYQDLNHITDLLNLQGFFLVTHLR